MPTACEVCGREPLRGDMEQEESRRACWRLVGTDNGCTALGYERQRARAEKLEKALREHRGLHPKCIANGRDYRCWPCRNADAALAPEGT